MYDTSEFRKGLKIEIEDQPYQIVDFQHVKPGKGTAFVRTRMRNLVTGATLDRTFRSGEKVGTPDLEQVGCTFMYKTDDEFHFMNQATFETMGVPTEAVGEASDYLIEQLEVEILFYRGRAIAIELPNFVDMKIVHCEPGVAGNTATGATKPVTLETGYVVNVPLFIRETDVLRIDTRDGRFVERVNR